MPYKQRWHVLIMPESGDDPQEVYTYFDPVKMRLHLRVLSGHHVEYSVVSCSLGPACQVYPLESGLAEEPIDDQRTDRDGDLGADLRANG
jgi:hypothetical protein